MGGTRARVAGGEVFNHRRGGDREANRAALRGSSPAGPAGRSLARHEGRRRKLLERWRAPRHARAVSEPTMPRADPPGALFVPTRSDLRLVATTSARHAVMNPREPLAAVRAPTCARGARPRSQVGGAAVTAAG